MTTAYNGVPFTQTSSRVTEPEERAIDLHTRYRHDIGACSPLFVSEKFVLETSLTLIGHATNPDRELGTVHRSKVQNEDLNS